LFVVLIIAAAVGIMLLPFTVAADLLYTYFSDSTGCIVLAET
jgi:hypothetical protein